MPTPIPNEWFADKPETLLTGDGLYALALSSVLGAAALPLRQLQAGPEANNDRGYPQVLDRLSRAILAVSGSMSAADALECHQAVWDWVGKLSPAGDQHELAFIFVLPAHASKEFETALAAGFGLPRIDPGNTGHAVWRRSGSFTDLLELLASVPPMDLVPLWAHRAADAKHASLASLRTAAAVRDENTLREAVRAVVAAFSGCEYLLDIFCRPPSHRNGNLLRSWLKAAGTESVTPQEWMDGTKQLAEWLSPHRAETPK
ncbi:MAG: hypothetical protein IH623_10235 [Verrucomicrobia bacterium]|nr:hypothetical protein [Verrucomicrobiota bacterium]